MHTNYKCSHIDAPLNFKMRLPISRALVGSLLAAVCVSRFAVAQRTAMWTWVGGSNTINQPGLYGAPSEFAPQNVPPGRLGAATWTDKGGNLWLFGGTGYDPAANSIGLLLNDLWEFNPTLHEWAWVGGSKSADSPGVYGTLGVPAPGNIPGGRSGAIAWTDTDGNFWLFGGSGSSATGNSGDLNDLWEYRPGSHEWAWVGGSKSADNGPGVYGTLGALAPGNIPGGRQEAVSWTDPKGNLWLFGGRGVDAKSVSGVLDDLWEFNPTRKEWAWMGGKNTLPRQGSGWPGVYGTQGKPNVDNIPGSRSGAVGWTDADGNLWLFGGSGIDSQGNDIVLNDLWEWNRAAKSWAWRGGGATSTGCDTGAIHITHCTGQPGTYGTLGASAASNIPGGRGYAAGWTDGAGNVWILGGQGYDSAGKEGNLNDFWRFNLSSSSWIWIGDNSVTSGCKPTPAGLVLCKGQPGVYGALGMPGSGNAPGGRESASAWKDNAGNLWLFGGYGADHAGNNWGILNDLWEYRVGIAVSALKNK